LVVVANTKVQITLIQVRLPAEFKLINKWRKRNQQGCS